MITRGVGPCLAAFALIQATPPAGAQQVPAPEIRSSDSVTIAANADYGAGAVARTLLGDEYRDLWAAPIRVPVLDLSDFAGGLTLVESGGRKQTRSLRFEAGDGREFVVRSVDKDPLLARSQALDGTLAGRLVRDQTSALFPASAVALPPLHRAAGVIHVVPQLVVLPDDPALGEFRQEYAGMLGMIEEHPDEGEEAQLRVAGSDLIIGSERFRERLLEGPEDRVNSRALLRARLLDAVLNDRDRHWDQYRWAEFERDETRYWSPVPEDRDYAFVDFNGLLPSLARNVVAHMVGFDGDFPSVEALSHNSFDMDRRLLAELPREAWDSATARLQAALTDDVIAQAAQQLPPSYQELAGEPLQQTLRARREALRSFGRAWYHWLSSEVDVHGTDAAEYATVEYLPDGSVDVHLHSRGEGSSIEGTFFRRRFLPEETKEVRIYLQGGDDRAVVRGGGARSDIRVRLIGGAGNDSLADSSTVRGGAPLSFHDAEGESNTFEPGPRTSIDSLPFVAPSAEDPISGARYRDFGSRRSSPPIVSYGSTLGLVLGGGVVWTRYGFRQVPHASEITISGAYSFRLQAAGLGVEGDWRGSNSVHGISLTAEATQLEPFHFFGLGNNTAGQQQDELYLVEQDLVRVHAAYDFHLAPRSRLSLGPLVKFSNLRPRGGTRSLPGVIPDGHVGQVGGRLEGALDLRDDPSHPRKGVFTSFDGTVYAPVWGVSEVFGDLQTAVSTYLSLPGARSPVLAVRAGARQVWGGHPAHEAAFLGGWNSLRGYETERFAGDAALWGAAELRVVLGRPKLLVRGDLGALAFADAGRVYVDGASPGGWHAASGGGFFFSFDFQGTTVASTVLYARGETDKVRIQLGLPF